jgi:hypothetical protein
MSRKALAVFAVLAALAAAPVARAQGTLSVEAFGGYQNLHLGSSAVGNALRGEEGRAIFGADALLGFGGLGIGAVVDKVVGGNEAYRPWSGAVMAGFLIPLTVVRIELMGELGRRGQVDFGDLFDGNKGQTFVGFRPGVSFRVPGFPLILGASGVARWPTSGGDFGAPDFALVGRVGFGVF